LRERKTQREREREKERGGEGEREGERERYKIDMKSGFTVAERCIRVDFVYI